jgi:hypothetical protein
MATVCKHGDAMRWGRRWMDLGDKERALHADLVCNGQHSNSECYARRCVMAVCRTRPAMVSAGMTGGLHCVRTRV